jgi:Transposase
MLPHATLTVDLFHVVQLAVKAAGDVRRRVVRARYGRRGRSGDPEYGIKGLLARNLEHLTGAQFATIIDTLDRDRYGQEIAAAWIGKEKLRDALNLRARVTGSTPCERQVRDRLLAFYDWCARHDDIPELITLARTISRWEDEITAAVLTGITSATSESLNRLAKPEARLAYGFRNPLNQRRRVRIACTRGYRRKSRTATRAPVMRTTRVAKRPGAIAANSTSGPGTSCGVSTPTRITVSTVGPGELTAGSIHNDNRAKPGKWADPRGRQPNVSAVPQLLELNRYRDRRGPARHNATFCRRTRRSVRYPTPRPDSAGRMWIVLRPCFRGSAWVRA